MSVIIDLEDFSKETQLKIDKMLTFTPIQQKKFNQTFSFEPSETPVKCYYTANKKVHLPYRFACCLMNKIFNMETYPPLSVNKDLIFKGKLLPRQEQPYQQALEHLKRYNTTTIALYPGFGKTFLGCMLTHRLNRITCVLVHRENVGKQWVKSYKSYIPDLKDEELWYVNDKVKLNAKIMICMAGRTDKIPIEMRKSVGTLIIDEAHCFCSESRVKPLLSFSPRFTIAETATPIKDNGMHKIIQSITGTHFIQKISNKPYKCYIIQTNLSFVTESKNTFTDLVSQQCESDERNRIIQSIVKDNPNKKIMIASPRTKHCDTIFSSISELGITPSKLYGTIKNYKTSNVLVGTTSKMGVGFDEANFCDDYDGKPSDLLIITQTFKSWPMFEQVRGRGMRADNPTVVYLNDKHSITRRHMSIMRKWIKETNGEIVELKIDKIKDFVL